MVLPDLEYLAKEYIQSTEADAAIHFMRDSYLGRDSKRRGLMGMIRDSYGNSEHLWMWDYQSLEIELVNAGFSDIRRAYYGDAQDSKFSSVENKERWGNCLGIECKK